MIRGPTDNARERIIDAAEQVVIKAGAGHLTLEAVASKTGVSREASCTTSPIRKRCSRGCWTG